MDILVDENIPLMTVAGLRVLGHDVKDIRGTGQQGLPDADLWSLVLAEKRMLITTDKGFTEQQGLPDADLWSLVLAEKRMLITTDKGFTERRRDRHSGILVVRLRQPNRQVPT